MKKCFITILSLLFFASVEANETSIQSYLELIGRYPKLVEPQGQAKNGEIEIVLNKEKMLAIEKSSGRDVGIVAQDKYWLWINVLAFSQAALKAFMDVFYGEVL